MPEVRWSARVREYESIARELDLTDDTCFIDMVQGCHAGAGDHVCACLDCIRCGAAFGEDDV